MCALGFGAVKTCCRRCIILCSHQHLVGGQQVDPRRALQRLRREQLQHSSTLVVCWFAKEMFCFLHERAHHLKLGLKF